MFLGISLLLCTFLVVPQLSYGDDVVKVLTNANFEKVLSLDTYTLVLFCTPYSPHCRDAKPEVQEAARRIGEIDKKKQFASVDCDAENAKDICKHQKVSMFPAMRLFYKGQIVQDYDASIQQDTLVSYMKKPPKLGGPSDLDEEDEAAVHEKLQGKDELMKDVKYLDVYGFKGYIRAKPNVIVFFYVPFSPGCKNAKQYIEEAATQMKYQRPGDVFVAAVNCEDEDSVEVCNEEIINSFPYLRLYKNGVSVGDFKDPIKSTSDIIKFLDSKSPETSPKQKIMKLMPEMPKENIKDEGDDMPVIKLDESKGIDFLDGSNFTQHVGKKGRHTLVMFYADWCPHCQETLPHYRNAGAMVKDNYKSRIMAAVNCAKNENEKLCTTEKIQNYPTFKRYFEGKIVDEPENFGNSDEFFTYMSQKVKPKKPGDKTAKRLEPEDDPEDEVEDEKAMKKDSKTTDADSKAVSDEKEIPKSETEEAEKPEERMKGVKLLDGDSFHPFITTPGQRTLVMFYAHWCSFCKESKPMFEKAFAELSTQGRPDLQLAAVNCVTGPSNENLCEEQKIEGYPTFVRYANGQRIDELDFNEQVKADKFLEFLKSEVKVSKGEPVKSPKDEL